MAESAGVGRAVGVGADRACSCWARRQAAESGGAVGTTSLRPGCTRTGSAGPADPVAVEPRPTVNHTPATTVAASAASAATTTASRRRRCGAVAIMGQP